MKIFFCSGIFFPEPTGHQYRVPDSNSDGLDSPCCHKPSELCSLPVLGISPCGDIYDEHFVVALTSISPLFTGGLWNYKLDVFLSEAGAWITKEALLRIDSIDRVAFPETDKVIALAGGLLGWVDLWWGILLCNVLGENPARGAVHPAAASDGRRQRGALSWGEGCTAGPGRHRQQRSDQVRRDRAL